MLKVHRFTVEHLAEGCVTDEAHPRFSFDLEADGQGVGLKRAVLQLGEWKKETREQLGISYDGPPLQPFTQYTVTLLAEDSRGERAEAKVSFETGRMNEMWTGQWISDPAYQFTEKKVSPLPMTFRRRIQTAKTVVRARIYATALGIYELALNGEKVGDRYFAPGFTSYKHNLQYQTYDVTKLLRGDDEIRVTVAGGWAVGSFVFTRANRQMADRQALLLELRLTYADGTQEVLGTDSSWEVTEQGPYQMADIYDGETYDATISWDSVAWRKAAAESVKIAPRIVADYSAPVKSHERLKPVSCTKLASGELIYDFGQNFAGVTELKIAGKKGQKVTIRHAEILNKDGSLNTTFLRSAKATATYTCREGEQTWAPDLTYMGFRYIGVSGAEEKDITVTGVARYSDIHRTGSFACSHDLLNRLQSNIQWSSRSNFVDIPTDCPQRDERMGWTGDIAVFAPTACYNFDMGRFLDKWLTDMRAEQFPGGGIPNTVPRQGYGFPTTMPDMAVDWWDDACVLVPWADYRAGGDVEVLRRNYPMMKKYVKACLFWAGLFSIGKNKYIWNTPAPFHFGDWVAPDVPQMGQWQARSKWTATASLKNTSGLVGKIAEILGETKDAAYYRDLSAKVADAYCSVLTDGNGKILGDEFQTAYVLPLYLDMFPTPEVKAKAAANLVELVKKSDYCIGTGFPGTPYILFALADNGYPDVAYKMLLNTKCPSWLYEVRVGATTIWERWDGLDENGECNIGDSGTSDVMISYNHYASGAVGDFLYRRVAGIEPIEPGYKTFAVKPLPGGGLTWAQGHVETPYGPAGVSWKHETEKGTFTVDITVPVGTQCVLTLPDGSSQTYGSGKYQASCPLA